MSTWCGHDVSYLGSASAVLVLVLFSLVASCSHLEPVAESEANSLSERSAEPSQLYSRERETPRGFERLQEVQRLDRVSIVRFSTNYWGGASDAFSFGLSSLVELSIERGFSHFIVLDECARRLGVAPDLGNDWQVVVGFLNNPGADPHAEFIDYDLSKRDCRAWPADRSALQPAAMGSDLWEAFTRPHWNFGGRAADGPDDEDWPQLCDDG